MKKTVNDRYNSSVNSKTFEQYVKDEFKTKVWNALEDVAFEFPEINDKLHKECMEQAIEYFMKKFYNED